MTEQVFTDGLLWVMGVGGSLVVLFFVVLCAACIFDGCRSYLMRRRHERRLIMGR
jgi:hypothetical protein